MITSSNEESPVYKKTFFSFSVVCVCVCVCVCVLFPCKDGHLISVWCTYCVCVCGNITGLCILTIVLIKRLSINTFSGRFCYLNHRGNQLCVHSSDLIGPPQREAPVEIKVPVRLSAMVMYGSKTIATW